MPASTPADIPRLLAELETGPAAMLQGVRIRRRDCWIRRASSRVANGFRNWVTGDAIRDTGCALRALRAERVERIPLFRGMHRFLPTLVSMDGWGVVEIPVAHRPRGGGRAKHGIRNRLWSGLFDTFGVRWLRFRCVLPRVRCSSREGELRDQGAEW